MKYLVYSSMLAILITLGCSSGATKLEPQEYTAQQYASDIANQVKELANEVKTPQQAAESGAVFVETLEVYESQPVGENGQTYAQLLAKCKELVSAGESGKKSDVSKILKEMEELANQLSGGE